MRGSWLCKTVAGAKAWSEWIAMSDDEKVQYSWGGCVVVTKNGAEQLVKRTPGMISIQ